MPKTAAERQAAYRARCNENGRDRRLNTWICASADLALERMAVHQGITKKAVIERLAIAAEENVLKALARGTPECEAYLAGVRVGDETTANAPVRTVRDQDGSGVKWFSRQKLIQWIRGSS